MRIILAEDDQSLGIGIQTALKRQNHSAEWVTDGEQALAAIKTETFDALILDLGLPKLDGLSVLKRLRQQHNPIPVLILTARDRLQDRVAGLDAGADDYLLKPFELDELYARLRAITRRVTGQTQNLIEYGDLVIHTDAQQVHYLNQDIPLSRREYLVLYELISHQGQVLSRPQLEQKIYAWGEEVESNALQVHIHHLRKKLHPELIKTVRGIGYRVEKI